MLTNIIYGFIYFIEMMISYIVFSRLAEIKYKFAYCLTIGTVLFEIGILINHIFSNTILLNSFFTVTVNIAFALICFKIKPLKAIFYSILLFVFATSIEFATIFIVSSLTQMNITSYIDEPMILIIESSISKILYFLLCIILLNFISKDKNDIKFPISLYTYPIIAVFSLMAFWYISVQSNLTHRDRQLLAIISIALLVATVLTFLSYQNNIKKENKYILLKNEFNRLQTEKNYYDVLEHQNQQLMIYVHDAKNHLSTIKGLNKDPQIDKYIQKMSDNLYAYSNTCHSGNMTLDVIINRYVSECSIKEIEFSFDVRLSNLSFVDDFDLVTILGNICDNAMEASEKSTQKFISLETDYRNSYEVIIITNSCDHQPRVNNDKLITTKKDTKIHGLGLKSVSKALKKYDGDISWEYLSDEKEFITTVMLRKKS